MATISIRVSDDLKAKLKGLAHESGGTISGVVTEALGSMVGSPRTDYPEEMAPLTIAPVNRLILRDQELILAALSEYEEDAAYHKRNAQIFEKGYVREYPEAFAALRPEIPNSRCEELYDILDMFRVLRASYEDLPEDEKAEVDERDISPQGFDYNDMEEGRLAGYVKHLFADKRYEELAEPLRKYSDGGNSHGAPPRDVPPHASLLQAPLAQAYARRPLPRPRRDREGHRCAALRLWLLGGSNRCLKTSDEF